MRYVIRGWARKALTSILSSLQLSTSSTVLTKTGIPTTYYNAVTQGGCVGNATTNNSSLISAAITAYKDDGYSGLYFPTGTYYLASTLIVPSDTVMVGATVAARNPTPGFRTVANSLAGCVEPTAWLKGRVDFGSNSAFSDLRIGNSGACGITNSAGASTTSFTRCQFRGGSTTPASVNSNVVTLGMNSGSCDHITFTDCNVERNVGPSDGSRSSFCNLALVADGSSSSGAYVSYITINRCHVGVTNGVATGSPCFNFVAYTNPVYLQAYAHHGWSNIVISDSVFEAADQTTLDLADTRLQSDLAVRASGPATVSGCFLKGSGMNAALPFPNCIDIEAPKEVLIENNTMYRARGKAISFGGGSGDAYGTIIRNNILTLNTGTAPTSSSEAVHLCGDDLTFTGNNIHVDAGWFPIWLKGVYNSLFTGNTIHDTRSSPPEAGNMVVLEGTASVTVTGNTLENGSGSNPIIYESAYGGATNIGNTISGNTFIHA